MPAFADTKVLVDSAIVQCKDAFAAYQQIKTNQTGATASQLEERETLAQKKAVLADLTRVEQTFEREYLDRRADPPVGNLFARMGLQDAQDWSLAIFYVAYAALTGAAVLFVLRWSSSPAFMAAGLVAGAGVLLVMITTALIYYG